MRRMRDWEKDWELSQRSTSGPWEVIALGPYENMPWSTFIANCGGTTSFKDVLVISRGCSSSLDEKSAVEDAQFIAEAREALPYWLQRAREFEVEIAVMREALTVVMQKVLEPFVKLKLFYEKAGKSVDQGCFLDEVFSLVDYRCCLGKITKALSSDTGCDILMRLETMETHVQELEAEVNEHRERANDYQTRWEMHQSMDCALKCALELKKVLGTDDVIEATKRVRKLQAVAEAAKALTENTGVWPVEMLDRVERLQVALVALEGGEQE